MWSLNASTWEGFTTPAKGSQQGTIATRVNVKQQGYQHVQTRDAIRPQVSPFPALNYYRFIALKIEFNQVYKQPKKINISSFIFLNTRFKLKETPT